MTLLIRCKCCNKELMSSTKPQCCGCPNQTMLIGEKITAVDLSKVELINSKEIQNNSTVLSKSDLEFQENRRKRKVRKLDFEVK